MEGSESGSVKIINYPDPGGPKTYGSYVSGSGTVVSKSVNFVFFAGSGSTVSLYTVLKLG